MGFAGTVRGSIFEAPEWVDRSKKPGHTDQSKVYPELTWKWILSWLNPWNSFINSPNLVWLAVAITTYVVCPYDLAAAKDVSIDSLGKQFIYRSCVDLFIMLTYFGFWSLTLYKFGFGERKFNPDYVPPPSRMFHNIWYCCLGAVQLAAWECAFMHLYATGKLTYIADEDLFSSPANIARTIGWTLAIPLWRSVHFYFAHRFIHINPLYKYVHSLHHRNNDIEPFSGLCMHPVEHLYYYSCVAPSLYFTMSPFHAMWNLIHLLISPAASHSGWEDNLQSDQFHYLHHKKFECNYGTSGEPLDRIFGTHRMSLDPKVKSYSGGASDQELLAVAKLNANSGEIQGSGKRTGNKHVPAQWGVCNWSDPKGALSLAKALPNDLPQFLFDLHYIVVWSLFLNVVAGDPLDLGFGTLDSTRGVGPFTPGVVWGLIISMGPLVCATALLLVFGKGKTSLCWPFHRDAIVGSFGVHAVASFAFALMPVYHTVAYLFNEPNQSPELYL